MDFINKLFNYLPRDIQEPLRHPAADGTEPARASPKSHPNHGRRYRAGGWTSRTDQCRLATCGAEAAPAVWVTVEAGDVVPVPAFPSPWFVGDVD